MSRFRNIFIVFLVVVAWMVLFARSFYEQRDAPMYDYIPVFVAGRMITDDAQAIHIYDRDAGHFNRVPPGPFVDSARAAGFDRTPTPYVYPPVYAWLMVPLATMSYHASKAVLLAMGALALVAGLWLARRETASRLPWRAVFLVTPLLLLVFTPLDYNNHLGQISTVIFALACLSLYLANRGRWVAAGAVLGFCIAVKLQPLGIPLLLLARRRYRLVAATAAAAVALVAVGGVLSGFDVLGRYLASVAEIASRGSLASWNNQTITAMLLRATHPAAEIFQWRYLETAWWMTALQLAVALGLAAWMVRAAAGTGGDGGDDHSVSYAGGVLVSLLLTPIAWTHAYVLLLLPLLWLAARLPQHHSFRRRVVWLAVLAVAWTLIALDAQSIASGVFPAGARAADGGAASLICSANLFGLLLLSVLCALVMARRRAAVE